MCFYYKLQILLYLHFNLEQKKLIQFVVIVYWQTFSLKCRRNGSPFADFLRNRCASNFAIFTGKHLCWGLFLKETLRQVFHMNISKFVRTSFPQNISGRLLLNMEYDLHNDLDSRQLSLIHYELTKYGPCHRYCAVCNS